MQKTQRESGIELLKIIAIICIVFSHVSQTFGIRYPQLLLDGSQSAIPAVQYVLTMMPKYLGVLGNNIFMISSAWFLCDSKGVSGKKLLQLLLDVWIISVGVMICFFLVGGSLSALEIRQCLMPTTFSVNWYTTCYVIVYMIHPLLNRALDHMTQRQLLTFCVIALIMYCGLGTIYRGYVFYASALVLFVVIYFVTAYMKRYMQQTISKTSVNGIAFAASLIAVAIMLGTAVFLDAKNGHFSSGELFRWNQQQDPFMLALAFSAFHLFRKMRFTNRVINTWSGLSLLVYIIHENALVRSYLRPRVFAWIEQYQGFDAILLWFVLFAVLLFLISSLLGLIYKGTLRWLVAKLLEWMYPWLSKFGLFLTDCGMKLK